MNAIEKKRDFLSSAHRAKRLAESLAQRLGGVFMGQLSDMGWEIVDLVSDMVDLHQKMHGDLVTQALRSSEQSFHSTFMGVCAGMAMRAEKREEKQHYIDLGNAIGSSLPQMELPEEPAAQDFSTDDDSDEGLE